MDERLTVSNKKCIIIKLKQCIAVALLSIIVLLSSTKITRPVTIDESGDNTKLTDTSIVKTNKLNNNYGTVYTREQISELASRYPKYSSIILNVTWCESHYKNVQSDIIYNGSREDSWGIAQINLRWHPEVTKEQALDPEFAIDFMAKRIEAGKAVEWTCWRSLYQ